MIQGYDRWLFCTYLGIFFSIPSNFFVENWRHHYFTAIGMMAGKYDISVQLSAVHTILSVISFNLTTSPLLHGRVESWWIWHFLVSLDISLNYKSKKALQIKPDLLSKGLFVIMVKPPFQRTLHATSSIPLLEGLHTILMQPPVTPILEMVADNPCTAPISEGVVNPVILSHFRGAGKFQLESGNMHPLHNLYFRGRCGQHLCNFVSWTLYAFPSQHPFQRQLHRAAHNILSWQLDSYCLRFYNL